MNKSLRALALRLQSKKSCDCSTTAHRSLIQNVYFLQDVWSDFQDTISNLLKQWIHKEIHMVIEIETGVDWNSCW